MNQNIQIIKGDSESIEVIVSNEAGQSFDLTGFTCKLSIKANSTFVKEGSIDNAQNNKVLFNLTSQETNIIPGNYKYDIQIQRDEVVKTIAGGIITVLADITQ